MPAERTCSQCGAPLPANAPGSRCPKCLLELGLEDSGGANAPERAATQPETDAVIEQSGMMIGRYKLLQQMGEGGFGVVFMAEQVEPVQRKVALKIIKAGMDTREIIARFAAERQALALMDHPNIAKILDAGTTEASVVGQASRLPLSLRPSRLQSDPAGEPPAGTAAGGTPAPLLTAGRLYFVMELVRGLPITNYCDQANLNTRERLELFIQVCRAVQHAHQKGVIHRDLKPTNVLVTLHDGEPVPKVIDFGVAKALGQKLTDKTLFTRFEQMLGTPAYMSPEQAALSGLDIDTRSDIYSLGVLLYELLTGVTPLDAETLRKGALDEIRRMIRETDPPKPSTRLLALGDRLAEVAKHRHVEPAALSRLVRGDLDWITMKALEKDRQRRYETVNGLARDIERHLHREPVVARPPTKRYLFKKFVNRHRLALGVASAVTFALVAGLAASTFSLLSERAARRRAVAAELRQIELRKDAQEALAMAEAERFKALQNLYAADMSLGYQALERGNLGQLRQLVAKYASTNRANPPRDGQPGRDPRGWEWRNLWQRSRGEELIALYGHSNVVTFAGVLADGRTVVSTSRDRTLRFWDLEASRLLETIQYPDETWCGALSPDRRWLAVGGEHGYWSVWDAVSRKLIFARTNSSPVRGIGFSSDGALLAVASANAVQVWNLSEFDLLREFARPSTDFRLGVAFSPDNRFLVYSQETTQILAPYTLLLYDIETGKSDALGTLEVGGALGLTFSSDGAVLICADRSGISLWDIHTRRVLKRLTNHRSQVISVALSPNGKLMASTGGDRTVRLWDTESWEEKRIFRGHELEVHSVAFSPDGKRALSCGKDEALLVWDIEQIATPGETYVWPPGWFLLPNSPDSPRLLRLRIGSGPPTRIGIVDLTRCEEQDTGSLPLAFGANDLPAVSADLRKLATLLPDGSIEIWGTAPAARLKAIGVSPAGARRIALGRSGRLLAVERNNGYVEILDLEQDRVSAMLQPLPEYVGDAFYSRLSFCARDSLLVRVTREPGGSEEIVAESFSPAAVTTKRIRLTHKDLLNNFTVSDDGALVATSAWDGAVKLWDLANNRELHTFSGPFQSYISTAFSPDNSRLAAGAGDGTVTIWDLPSLNQVAHWKAHFQNAGRVCFLEGGDMLMTRGSLNLEWANWETHVWRPPSLTEIDAWVPAPSRPR